MVLITFLLIVSGAGSFGLISSTQMSIASANEKWEISFQQYFDKMDAFQNLRIELGYNGFIHHFKNYLIRRDPKYLEWSEQSMSRARIFADRLEMLVRNDKLDVEIAVIKETLTQYRKGLNYLQSELERASNSELAALDKIVKVDDSPAALAMSDLGERLELELMRANIEMGDELKKVDKRFFWFAMVIFPTLVFSAGLMAYYFRRQANEYDTSEAVLQSLTQAVLLININGEIEKCNKYATQLTGYSSKELKIVGIDALVGGESVSKHVEHRRNLFKRLEEDPSFANSLGNVMSVSRTKDEFELRQKDGTLIPAKIKLAVFNNRRSQKVIAVVSDLSQLNELRKEVRTDSLTGTSTKQSIGTILQSEVQRSRRYDRALSVIFVDIDEFKAINDSYGHQKGDVVLKEFAKFLAGRLRQQDSIGRFGGEEFLIVLPETNIREAQSLAESIRQALSEVRLADLEKLTASFGVATIEPEDEQDALVNIIKRADDAMYLAKRTGKDKVKSIKWGDKV